MTAPIEESQDHRPNGTSVRGTWTGDPEVGAVHDRRKSPGRMTWTRFFGTQNSMAESGHMDIVLSM